MQGLLLAGVLALLSGLLALDIVLMALQLVLGGQINAERLWSSFMMGLRGSRCLSCLWVCCCGGAGRHGVACVIVKRELRLWVDLCSLWRSPRSWFWRRCTEPVSAAATPGNGYC
jgi:hypothetical protein